MLSMEPPQRVGTPFVHGRGGSSTPSRSPSGSSGSPRGAKPAAPRWQTLLDRLSLRNPLAPSSSPSTVGHRQKMLKCTLKHSASSNSTTTANLTSH